jgi:hypothetical protein
VGEAKGAFAEPETLVDLGSRKTQISSRVLDKFNFERRHYALKRAEPFPAYGSNLALEFSLGSFALLSAVRDQ